MKERIELLAKGPWESSQVQFEWLQETFTPPAEVNAAADLQLSKLRDRGSPAHDGLAGRLEGFSSAAGRLSLRLQPARWSLRLVPDNGVSCISALCVTRSASGEWLAGRRAPWVASWAGRWALGAGGAIEVGENPVETLSRELEEEWSVAPERLSVEGLFNLPNRTSMLIGMAWLNDGDEVTMDEEHDEYLWLPKKVDDWPEFADMPLRMMAKFLDPDA